MIALVPLGGCILGLGLTRNLKDADTVGTIGGGAVIASRADDTGRPGGGALTSWARMGLGRHGQPVRVLGGVMTEIGGEHGAGAYWINGVDLGVALAVPHLMLGVSGGAYAGGLPRGRTTLPVRASALVGLGRVFVDAGAWVGWRLRSDDDDGPVGDGPLSSNARGAEVRLAAGSGDGRGSFWLGVRWEDWDGEQFGVLGFGGLVASTFGMSGPDW